MRRERLPDGCQPVFGCDHIVIGKGDNFAPSRGDACVATVRDALFGLEDVAEVGTPARNEILDRGARVIARIVVDHDDFVPQPLTFLAQQRLQRRAQHVGPVVCGDDYGDVDQRRGHAAHIVGEREEYPQDGNHSRPRPSLANRRAC